MAGRWGEVPTGGPTEKRLRAGNIVAMHEERRFTRLAMVRLGGAGGGVRRYGLARLDEIALATPPMRSALPESDACLPDPSPHSSPGSPPGP